MRTFGKAELGAVTFCASCQPSDECGANGLPLTPNSIRILGRFQRLKGIHHQNLARYVHLTRSKHERLLVVSEFYKNNLSLESRSGKYSAAGELVELAFGVLQGLAHLNQTGLVHRCLSPANILLDPEYNVLLANYGMYDMTHYGADVAFPIGVTKYLAPEVFAQGPVQLTEFDPTSDEPRRVAQPPSGPKVDVWSLGLCLLEAYLGIALWEELTIQKIFRNIVDLALAKDSTPLDEILKQHGMVDREKEIPQEVVTLLKLCLTVSPSRRPLPSELLELPMFKGLAKKQKTPVNGFYMFSAKLRCAHLDVPTLDEDCPVAAAGEDYLSERSIDEVFYLWLRAGGDLEAVLKKAALIRNQTPVTKLARFFVEEGELFGERRDRSTLLDDRVVILPQDQLRQRLEKIDAAAYYPLLEEEYSSSMGTSLPVSQSTGDLMETSKLPLVIRERDVEYQFHRLILFERLLKAYPYKKAHVLREARVDVPPQCRAHLWAALLDVEGDVIGKFDAIDKETPTATDRQIEVDIPRCHQYDDMLSSPEGHAKFKRVLKAWVVSHTEYVYWQGLDSLTAPFLYLNFNDEALAYACLSAFIPKYLHKFFLKDNSTVIQEYLAVFGHLIAFHDPELATHLDGIGFIPDLYAIPWFLTMYAHVFPLHKIFHLWDTLLLGNSSFPLCIGVAILQQLRDQLLSFGFNECILLFSDMPQIDIEQCVQESIRIFCTTPKSATYRQHAQKPEKSKVERPNLSYYSVDYNDMPRTEQSIDVITLPELKTEKCPRVSTEDLIELSELLGPSPTRSPSKRTKAAKPKILIIDVRSQDEYVRGAVPNSINIPFSTAFGGDGQLLPSLAVQTLNAHKNQVKVIVGSRHKQATQFAESLLLLSYAKVCVLHKGIDCLRSSRLLVVPTPDL